MTGSLAFYFICNVDIMFNKHKTVKHDKQKFVLKRRPFHHRYYYF